MGNSVSAIDPSVELSIIRGAFSVYLGNGAFGSEKTEKPAQIAENG